MDTRPTQIQLVIFDLTGTTVWDGDGTDRCLDETFQAVRASVSQERIRSVAGISKPAAIRILLSDALGRRPTDFEVRAVHEEFVRRMIAYYRSDPAVGEMPGATAVIRQLKDRGYKIALDTGCSRAVVDAILDRLGWRDSGLIDATVASDEVGQGRPHADLVLAAMRRTRVSDVSRTAKVGDTPADLLEGMAAGCGLVIGVTNGTHTRAQLAMHPHTHLVASLGELPGIFTEARVPLHSAVGASERWFEAAFSPAASYLG